MRASEFIVESVRISLDKLVPTRDSYDMSQMDPDVINILARMAGTPSWDDDAGTLVVRPRNDGKYDIIDGHHRYFGLKKAGMKDALVNIKDTAENHLITHHQYKKESFANSLKEGQSLTKLPWDGNPDIGWWADNPIMRMYHGTNIDYIDSIAREGLNRLDAGTGMISLAFEPFTARAFAVMGGEARFLSANSKARALIVPENKRSVLVLDIPSDFVFKYIDRDLHGNDPEHKQRLTDKSLYEEWTNTDQQYYQLCEMRLASVIPPKFIVGYMIKS